MQDALLHTQAFTPVPRMRSRDCSCKEVEPTLCTSILIFTDTFVTSPGPVKSLVVRRFLEPRAFAVTERAGAFLVRLAFKFQTIAMS